MEFLCICYQVSVRRATQTLSAPRATLYYQSRKAEQAHLRHRIKEIATRMTYIELSADNTFYEAFTQALFLPHTDLSRFPSVQAVLPEIGQAGSI